LLLDESIGKTLLFVVRGTAMTVNMVSDLMHKDIFEVEVAEGVKVMAAQVERMGTKKDARTPVKTIASEFALPGPILLAPSGQQENSAQADNVRRWHLGQPVRNVIAAAGMNESDQRSEGNDAGKNGRVWKPVIEAFVSSDSLGEERVIDRPVGKFGLTVGIASWP
jgi:hypothetical protein